jgi:Mg-chelatase subunit ChlD
MNYSYDQVVLAANQFIRIRAASGDLISVVSFGRDAYVLFKMTPRELHDREGYQGGGTSFVAALTKVIPLIQETKTEYECRIVFFTDGQPDSFPENEIARIRSRNIRLDAIGIGSVCKGTLDRLVSCGGEVQMGNANNLRAMFVKVAQGRGPLRH